MTSRLRPESGFSLLELLVSIAILSIVSSVALDGIFRLTKVSQTVSNRTEMHAGVRNATELLQQEVGQAGRIALPHIVQLAGDPSISQTPVAVAVKVVDADGNTIATENGTDGMFVGEKLVIDAGGNEETVTVTAIDTLNKTFSAAFNADHDPSDSINVYGGFAYGVIPEKNVDGTPFPNGSTESVMKIVGDINSDGTLQYVEYTCDTEAGNLYRRTMPFMATSKPENSVDKALLNNIKENPDDIPCFTYQQQRVNLTPYVVDVAITLTVRTSDKDPVTGLYQTETKALLNVSPRNVFNVWQLDSDGVKDHVQDLPVSVNTLIGLP
jgi:prepilin-type N-terminal cleavage/methylation domain-containing protein